MTYSTTRHLFSVGAIIALSSLVVAIFATTASAVTIPTVPVGNAGNANDTHGAGHGAVAYNYRIGTTEVTVGQYTEFLNAVAVTDTYAL